MWFHVFAGGFTCGERLTAGSLICVQRLATSLVLHFAVFLTFSAVTLLAGPPRRAEQNRAENKTESEGYRQLGLLSHYITSFEM
jgi:hypothetical protein